MTIIAIDRTAQVREGLAAFDAFLEQNPGFPLGKGDPFRLCVRAGTYGENRAEVDRIASLLGVKAGPGWDEGNYVARRNFGGGVVFEAWAIGTEADRTRFRLASWIGAEGITGHYGTDGIASRVVAAISPQYVNDWLDRGETAFLRSRCERIRDAADLTDAEHAVENSGRVRFEQGAFAAVGGAA